MKKRMMRLIAHTSHYMGHGSDRKCLVHLLKKDGSGYDVHYAPPVKARQEVREHRQNWIFA